MKDVQCYELFGGIALKNHAFSFFQEMSQSNALPSLKGKDATASGLRPSNRSRRTGSRIE